MKLFEYEAKQILKKLGIPVPRGETVSQPGDAEAIARSINRPVVVKSQILVSGRGKAGGIKFADDPSAARQVAASLLGTTIKGCAVDNLLIEEKLDIAQQYYASVTIDRQARNYIILASTSGGVDIEEVAKNSPDKIARHRVDPLVGFSEFNALNILSRFKLPESDASRFAAVIHMLYKVAMDYDAELIELNPLVKTASGQFVAADSRIIIDDNAVFRHPEFAERSLVRPDDTPLEAEARKQKIAYVDLDGDIGIVGNGAGLEMATVDLAQTLGGKPGNFLDIGGSGNVKKGIMLVMSKPTIKAVLVNVFGGIIRCDVVAQAVVEAIKESSIKKPVVVRLMGTNEEEGTRILKEVGIASYHDMEQAVAAVVKTSKGEKP